MGDRQPARAERDITPKDVFARSNMPSRWERLTSVSPKTASDRKFLAFVAARYRGDKHLPRPDELIPPDEFETRRVAYFIALAAGAVALVTIATGLAAELLAVVVAGIVIALLTFVAVIAVHVFTQPAIGRFDALKARCQRAEARLHADPMDSQDTSTINKMILCDEGTLAYCAAKIASEIQQNPHWRSSALDIVPIDLWDELAEVGESARQINEDREATTELERSRLSDTPDIRATIDEDKQARREAITLLAARVNVLADYRDHAHSLSITARRDKNALSRTVRRVKDEQARERML